MAIAVCEGAIHLSNIMHSISSFYDFTFATFFYSYDHDIVIQYEVKISVDA